MHYHKPEVHQDDRIMAVKITLESQEDEFTKFRFSVKKFVLMDPPGWNSFMACLHEIIINLLFAEEYAERKTAKR